MKKLIAMLLIVTLALTSVFASGAEETTGDTVRVAYMTNYAALCSVLN